MTERIQKALARAGIGSRREIETWILEGRVRVNDAPAELGQQLDSKSRVSVDGKNVRLARAPGINARVLLYHKPTGEICSRDDPQGRRSVFESLPRLRGQRWVSVGRLDINTSGLLIFTNDGDLANRLMHPSSGLEREYRCRVRGSVSQQDLNRLMKGVNLDGETCRFESIAGSAGSGANHWFRVVVKEGRYREVRRMWQSVGCTVNRLIRIRYGPFILDRRHAPGEAVELAPELKAQLMRSLSKNSTRSSGPAAKSRRPLRAAEQRHNDKREPKRETAPARKTRTAHTRDPKAVRAPRARRESQRG